jgi:hypothetical protein
MKQLSQIEVLQVAGGDSPPLPIPLPLPGPTCPPIHIDD